MSTTTPRTRRRASMAVALTGLLTLTMSCGDDDDGDDATQASGEIVAPTDTGTDAGSAAGSGTGVTTDAAETSVTTGDPGDTGGSSPSTGVVELAADEAGYTTAVAEYLQSPSGVSLSAAQAECAAPGWVAVITVDRFEESDQGPDDVAAGALRTVELGLDEDQAQELLDALTDCDVDLRALFLSSVGEGPAATCVDEQLTDETIGQLLREALVNEQPSEALSAEIERVAEACGLGD